MVGVLRKIRRVYGAVSGFVGSVVIIVAVVLSLVWIFSPDRPSLPDRMVLRIVLGAGLTDGPPAGSLFSGARGPMLRDIVEGLEVAAEDERVASVVIRMAGIRTDLADIQELRDAIATFRESGKPARLFSRDIGGIGGGTAAYYLAAGADEIWLQPSGGVGLIGLAMEIPFGRGLLEKLEVEARVGKRHEYKAASESVTETALSAPARENLQALLDSLFGQIVAGIARDRGLDEAEMRDLVDNGPYLAGEALAKGLVDRLGYWDEFISEALGGAGEEAEEVGLRRYLKGIDRPNTEGPMVALIHGRGTIRSGTGDSGSPLEEPGFGAHRIAAAIADVVEDEEIKAILFRVDSPGGSYVASDIVWREVARARQAGKPVIVSMGGTAASGGYFVAMAADRIVAQPGTVTGSIGVFGGKLVTTKFWEKLGVTWDRLQVGEHANMWSFVSDFPPGAEARFSDMLDFIYEDFTRKVMADRGLDAEQVDAVARGRVWSGEDALRLGLVDALGGYATAIDEVKAALGLDPSDSIELVLRPRPATRFEQIAKVLDGSEPLVRAATLFGDGPEGQTGDLARVFGPLAEDLAVLVPPEGVLQMPAMRIRQ